MTKPAVFTSRDVSKALRGAKAAGVAIEQLEIEIGRDGRIVLRPAPPHEPRDSSNPWDVVLDK